MNMEANEITTKIDLNLHEPETLSIMKIGIITIQQTIKFNFMQRYFWKKFFNIKIENVKKIEEMEGNK